MKRALPLPHQILLSRHTLLTLLAGGAAALAVTLYLMIGGDVVRGALAYAAAVLTAISLERSGVGVLRRWAFALPVGSALYVLLLGLR